MAEKLDFKEFYENTKPTTTNIHLLGIHISHMSKEDKNYNMATSTKAFGMLAHLNIVSNGDTPYISANLFKYGVTNPEHIRKFNEYLVDLKICRNFEINPTALPIIKKYREAFDIYEKQNGIQNPLKK